MLIFYEPVHEPPPPIAVNIVCDWSLGVIQKLLTQIFLNFLTLHPFLVDKLIKEKETIYHIGVDIWDWRFPETDHSFLIVYLVFEWPLFKIFALVKEIVKNNNHYFTRNHIFVSI